MKYNKRDNFTNTSRAINLLVSICIQSEYGKNTDTRKLWTPFTHWEKQEHCQFQ